MRSALALIAVLVPVTASAAGREVTIIIDTSGSMEQSDRSRYTAQLAKIVADLLDPDDRLTVIRMPGSESCADGPDPSLVLRLDPADRAGFKRAVDAFVSTTGGTYFSAPIRTAVQIVTLDGAKSRLLLMLADSGGLGLCTTPLTGELRRLRESGATVAAINLGASGGAFDGNPGLSFTTGAPDVESLARAVALVYQRFIGARRVQTGALSSSIAVDVPAHVRSAFLVVAADGPIAAIDARAGNPGAEAIDTNYRGGGETRGLDGRNRGYRIVQLRRPRQGRWTFVPRGLSAGGGWMLVLDYAVGFRLQSSDTFVAGAPGLVELQVYDEDTGATLDPASLPGLDVGLEANGRVQRLNDSGLDGDRAPGDGTYSTALTFETPGSYPVRATVRSGDIERTIMLTAAVTDAPWIIRAVTPAQIEAGRPVIVSARLEPTGAAARASAARPGAVHASMASDDGASDELTLRDDGTAGDQAAGDGVYSARWQTATVGRRTVAYRAAGGSPAAPARADLDVLGRIEFGGAGPVAFGTLHGGSEAGGEIDLSSATVFGRFDVRASTSLARSGVALEVDLGSGWQRLDDEPVAIVLDEHGRRRWPLRIRVGDCPEGVLPSEYHELVFEVTTAAGRPARMAVPLAVVIVPDPWLHCWWPVLVMGFLLLSGAIMTHGYWSPYRFPRGASVVISDVEDMDEGFAHPIRAEHGTGVGFYRDAAVYLCSDYRLRGRPVNAIARLRAGRRQLHVRPESGRSLYRYTSEGKWERLPDAESLVRPGMICRTEEADLFFEVRTL